MRIFSNWTVFSPSPEGVLKNASNEWESKGEKNSTGSQLNGH